MQIRLRIHELTISPTTSKMLRLTRSRGFDWLNRRSRINRLAMGDPPPDPQSPVPNPQSMNELILVVDDEPKIIRLARDYLEGSGFRVLPAMDGNTALAAARTDKPDLVVLDLNLPGMDGLDVCRALRRESSVPIIMLTARADETDRLIGLELGADDYVVKPYSLREVTSRIRALLRRAYGELALNSGPATITFGPIEIDLERMWVRRHGDLVDLTPTEFRLLRQLVANPDRPISRDALIEAVWGYDGDLGNDRTIDVHMRHLRQKLEDDPGNPRFLLTVRGVGYKFQPPASVV
ncbi:MAG: response regulator transcription factor [Caldilineaceae bacterium]